MIFPPYMPYNTPTVISYQVAFSTLTDSGEDQYIQINFAKDTQDVVTYDGGACWEKRSPFVRWHSGTNKRETTKLYRNDGNREQYPSQVMSWLIW